MTLIATIATPLFVMQAGDRLLTRTNKDDSVEIFDANSNKSIIYEASDGLLSISYCGKAFFDNIPTDEWIARALHPGVKKMFDDSPTPYAISLTQLDHNSILSTGSLIKLLQEKFDKIPESEVQEHGVSVTICGWKFKRSRVIPVLIELRRLKGSKNTKPDGYKRKPGMHKNSVHSLIGTGSHDMVWKYFDDAWDAIHRGASDMQYSGTNSYLDSVRYALASTIQHAAKIDPTVGKNVHIATFRKPTWPNTHVETHFFGTEPHPATIYLPSPTGQERKISVPDAAVTGWVLTPFGSCAPSYLVGRYSLHGAFSHIDMVGANSQNNVHAFFQTIRRRRV
ncbi:hypothetical protein [Burkholderia cepacia]|uniref:hypothetical protein n=1 Tax=Burkholderia cepacia TaxID=292 RepID=UPI001F373056|nr:hypothetical protein [Burkholderia cepacia]MCE4125620.1 hypothetical protein [Burkholderia cepacia]